MEENKVVLITGSSRGVGRELAKIFAEGGNNVVITYKQNREEGEKTLEECNQNSGCLCIQLDVENKESIDECYKEVLERFGKIDILINNAGVLREDLLEDQTLKEIDNQINTNLSGLIKMSRKVLPLMKEQKKGKIINIASGAGKKAKPRLSLYCATKAGVIGFSKSLSKEVPEYIKVICLNYGVTSTEMTNFEGNSPKEIAKIVKDIIDGKVKYSEEECLDVWRFL